jgi:hypothetical protein
MGLHATVFYNISLLFVLFNKQISNAQGKAGKEQINVKNCTTQARAPLDSAAKSRIITSMSISRQRPQRIGGHGGISQKETGRKGQDRKKRVYRKATCCLIQ